MTLSDGRRLRCRASVWDRYGGWRDHQCRRAATTTRELAGSGGHRDVLAVCTQHAKPDQHPSAYFDSEPGSPYTAKVEEYMR